ncbi:MAG: M1 family aminopeptidase [Acidobacteriota bacterium]
MFIRFLIATGSIVSACAWMSLLSASPGWAMFPDAATAVASYEPLVEGRWGSTTPLPTAVTFTHDTATWTLERGTVRLMQPRGGVVTGVVFEGEGRFSMTIPDPIERRHLARTSERPEMDRIDQTFGRLVLRTTVPGRVERWLDLAAPDGPFSDDDLATDRHEHWLVQRIEDIDARVIAGLSMRDDDYLRIDVETADFSWLTYEHDSFDGEEITLSHYDRTHRWTEAWIRLDRPEQRLDSGRPGSETMRTVDLEHVDLSIDLTPTHPEWSKAGQANITVRRPEIEAEMVFTPQLEGLRALSLLLSSSAEVDRVTTADGTELPFIRDQVGKRNGRMFAETWDVRLLVLADTPWIAGESTSLTVHYRIPLTNYVSGRLWYPGEVDGFNDPHTAVFTMTGLEKQEVRAMGNAGELVEGDGTWTRTWRIDRPVRMATFALSERPREQTVELDGVPAITAFASTNTRKNQLYNVAVDIANSISFFQQIFDHRLETDNILATSITGIHGQSFEGFLHLSELSMERTSEGPTERFRAHETAHQWWGHVVGWKSYRDQWLSEAFAEYSAMLFLEASMPEEEYYQEMVDVYSGIVRGEIDGASRFSRLYALERNDKERRRIGPISLGYRAATGETPSGYVTMSYVKGAVVLHMLRGTLRGLTQNDEMFFAVIRTFVDRYAGRAASTADFIAVLDEITGREWKWFFNQWIDGTDIPSFEWSWQPTTTPEGQPAIALTVRLSDVETGWRMPVPVAIYFDKKKEDGGQVMVVLQQSEETFVLPVPRVPRSVEFNPDNAVLASTRER